MKNLNNEIDTPTTAVIYLRWACEPSAERRQKERELAVSYARALGLSAEVHEEVGRTAEEYSKLRSALRNGRYSVLVLRELNRVGRSREAVEEALQSAAREGWRIVGFLGGLDTAADDFSPLWAMAPYMQSRSHSLDVRRALAAKRDLERR